MFTFLLPRFKGVEAGKHYIDDKTKSYRFQYLCFKKVNNEKKINKKHIQSLIIIKL